MSFTGGKPARRIAGVTSDTALSALGCGLAAASATFGIVMAVHGPVANFGKSGEFTVFAQLAPRRGPAAGKTAPEELDLTETASIPSRAVAASTSERATPASVTLQEATADAATILLDGRATIVRVGDSVPGLGEILAIVPGAKPLLRTTRGVIAAAQEP